MTIHTVHQKELDEGDLRYLGGDKLSLNKENRERLT